MSLHRRLFRFLFFFFIAIFMILMTESLLSGDITLQKDLTIGQNSGDKNLIFGLVADISLDQEENIYVLDTSNSRIQIFDAEGSFLRSAPFLRGQGPQEISFPPQMAVTPQGMMCLLDANVRKIVVFSREGSYTFHFLLDFPIRDVVPYKEETIAVLGMKDRHLIHVYDLEGNLLHSFCEPFPVPRQYSQHKNNPSLQQPLRIDSTGDGTMYILHPNKNELFVFQNAEFLETIRISNPLYKPMVVTKSNVGGLGIVSPVAFVERFQNLMYITLQGPGFDPENRMDVMIDGKVVGSVVFKGIPRAMDSRGYLYVAEGEDYPLVVRYRPVTE